MEKDNWIGEKLADISARRLARALHIRDGVGGVFSTSKERIISFSSNDYLNFSSSNLEGSAGYSGACSSRLISGTLACHQRLENEIATFFEYPASLLYGAGYLANLGALGTILGRNDVVFSDRLIHASLIDGIRLSAAKNRRFHHNDVEHLEELLRHESRVRKTRQKFLIVCESLYSMDGDLAPIGELVELAERYDSLILVDEAHAIGVFGEAGRGYVNQLGLSSRVDLITGTASKSLASYGGFVLGSEQMRALQVSTSRSFIYNTALPPAVVETSSLALARLEASSFQGKQLIERAAEFRKLLNSMGFDTLGSDSQIIPLVVGDNERALTFAELLKERGILVVAMRSPTVPEGSARLRLSVTLAHSEDDLQYSAESLAEVAKQLGVL